LEAGPCPSYSLRIEPKEQTAAAVEVKTGIKYAQDAVLKKAKSEVSQIKRDKKSSQKHNLFVIRTPPFPGFTNSMAWQAEVHTRNSETIR